MVGIATAKRRNPVEFPRHILRMTQHRSFLLGAVALAITVAAPLAAQAQDRYSNDRAYCAALSDIYARYVGNSQEYHANRRPEIEGRVALDKCQQGDTAWAIPVLERKLRNSGVTLPQRG